jgi:helix-turn-helix, Psq domain
MAKRPTQRAPLQKGQKPSKSPMPYQSPTVSDDEEILDINDIPTPIRLNNAYDEFLDPQNTKGVRQLAREHGISKSSLQGRIKGAKSKV